MIIFVSQKRWKLKNCEIVIDMSFCKKISDTATYNSCKNKNVNSLPSPKTIKSIHPVPLVYKIQLLIFIATHLSSPSHKNNFL